MVTGTAEEVKQATGEMQVKPPASDTGLAGKEGGAEKTYRQSEVDALLGRAGQKVKANLETVTTERNTLKSELGTLTAEITEAKDKITSLTKDIEAMSEDDPDKHGLVQRRKELEAELKSAKAERTAIADSKKEVDKWKRDQRVYSVADEFVTADGLEIDKDSFMKSADKFKLTELEELEALAEDKGFKRKSETPEVEPATLKPYSGITEGGRFDVSKLSAREKVQYALTHPK